MTGSAQGYEHDLQQVIYEAGWISRAIDDIYEVQEAHPSDETVHFEMVIKRKATGKRFVLSLIQVDEEDVARTEAMVERMRAGEPLLARSLPPRRDREN